MFLSLKKKTVKKFLKKEKMGKQDKKKKGWLRTLLQPVFQTVCWYEPFVTDALAILPIEEETGKQQSPRSARRNIIHYIYSCRAA